MSSTSKSAKDQKNDIPSVFNPDSKFGSLLNKRIPVFFFDYDGTLTPIVSQPEDAILSEEMRQVLNKLSFHCQIAVVSGRDHDDVESLVGLKNIIYAGSHGYHISGKNGLYMELPAAKEKLPELDEMELELINKLAKKIAGVKIDRKRYAIAVHYRNVSDDQVDNVKSFMEKFVLEKKGFKSGKGKKVIEIKPDIDWDKGKAVNWILEQLNLTDTQKYLPIYLGDDITDEDAFRELQAKGIGILVGSHDEETLANYSIDDVPQVKLFLHQILDNFNA